MSTTEKNIKIPYPIEGVVRTAQLDDTISPENSAQLLVNGNFDRVGAVQTRLGVEEFADQLDDSIRNYGTLNNFIIPAGFERILELGDTSEFSALGTYISAQLLDSTHAIVFWCGAAGDGFAQVMLIDIVDGGMTPIGTPLEFDTADATENKCIIVDGTHVLNVWTGTAGTAKAQVFSISGGYAVTAIGSPYQFDTNGSGYAINQVDSSHFIVFYTGTGTVSDSAGIATILEVNLSTFAVTEPGSKFTFEEGSAIYNSAATLDDGTHFINFWDNINQNADIEILAVGGGGSGGYFNSGGNIYGCGAGAGGYIYDTAFPISPGSYSVTIGQGGAAQLSNGNGQNGTDTVFSTITAFGGGYGGQFGGPGSGGDGGSGGGSDGIGSQGHNGGAYISPAFSTPGGGGAGADGGDGTGGSAAPSGGDGLQNSISGTPTYYAGGGAGGYSAGADGTGGLGGGGDTQHDGTDGLGGGGGAHGGAGGSGVLVISYPTGAITATGGTITTSGGRTIHTFTTDGTFSYTYPTAIGGKTQVFEVNTGTWDISALSVPHIFDTASALYNSAVAVGDGFHFLNFWNGLKSGPAGGYAQAFAVNPSTFAITEPSSAVRFDNGGGTYNSAVSMNDGIHFVNFWFGESSSGYGGIFSIDAGTYTVTKVTPPVSLGSTSPNMYNSALYVSSSRVVDFWSGSDTHGEGAVFKLDGLPLRQNYLYAHFDDEVDNWDGSSWTVRRSGLSPNGGKARFAQYLGFLWMCNGNATIGDAIAVSNGGDFETNNSLIPDEFPPVDYISAGFEGRVWGIDALYGIIYYTDIVQFVPPDTYTLGFNPSVNFISNIAPQSGETMTGIFEVPRALLIFTENTITRIYGATSLDAYPAYNVGTYSQESIVQTKTGIFFHHSSGIYQFDYGGQPVEISRRIIDFIQAIPRDNYENIIGVWDGFDAVEWAIGEIEVEGQVFTNCVIRYTISTQVWTVYDYVGNYITAMISFDDGDELVHLMGTDVGKTGALDVGFTDFEEPFYFEYIDRWRAFSNMYAEIKTITGFNVYSENAAGTNMYYQIQKQGANVWAPIDTVDENNQSLFPNGSTDDFDVIRLRLAGTTKGTQIVIHGIEILSITNKGYDSN